MELEPATLKAIKGAAPALTVDALAPVVEDAFGIGGEYSPLVSERDQNFMLRTGSGEKFVVKVTSRFEEAIATDFQIDALRYLERHREVLVPRVYPTHAGETSSRIADDHGDYRLRVVTWLEGNPLESQPMDAAAAGQFGTALARLDRAFEGFSHPGQHPALLWDLQRVVDLRDLLSCIDDADARAGVARAVDDYESQVVPALPGLRSQVIHGDPNPGNVLLTPDGIGFIDFGDMVRAPRVFNVAIAASYQRAFESNPLQLIVPFITAYHAVLPLESLEGDVLFDLVRARLATTITLLYWRLAARGPDDPYRQKALADESGAAQYLGLLDSLGRERFRREIAFVQ